MNHYAAFGLQIESELSLPELLASSTLPPDVTIRFGPVPEAMSNPPGDGSYFHATPDTFFLALENMVRYLVVKGKEIWIDRVADCPEDILRLYLLGSVFGALLQQRRFLVMHASSIQTAHGAVLFVGSQGNGKSTLLTALVRRGYAMLADDVTAVTVESPSGPVAFGSFPHLRLCADTAARLDYPVEGLPRIPTTQKYLVPVTRFCAIPQPVHAVYELAVHQAPNILLEPVQAAERFAVVGNNTYRSKYLAISDISQRQFRATAQLAKAVHIGRITRPASPFMLDELVDRLVKEFGDPTFT
jgi:hypothetical protein